MKQIEALTKSQVLCIRSLLAAILGCNIFNNLWLRAANARLVLEPFTLVAFYTARRRGRRILLAVGYGDLDTFEKVAEAEGATHLVWPRIDGACPEGYEPWRCACLKRRWQQ